MEKKREKHHIMVIDDDEMLLEAMKKKLELANYKVTTANNIQDAYFKLKTTKPDMIMLDVVMPDINGIEFMNLINAELMTVNTPVVLMSALDKNEVYEMGYKYGAWEYLAKPFDVNKLPQLLDRSFAA